MKKEYLIARIDPFGKIDTIVISKPHDEPINLDCILELQNRKTHNINKTNKLIWYNG
jgi:hypothetical protein